MPGGSRPSAGKPAAPQTPAVDTKAKRRTAPKRPRKSANTQPSKRLKKTEKTYTEDDVQAALKSFLRAIDSNTTAWEKGHASLASEHATRRTIPVQTLKDRIVKYFQRGTEELNKRGAKAVLIAYEVQVVKDWMDWARRKLTAPNEFEFRVKVRVISPVLVCVQCPVALVSGCITQWGPVVV